MSPRSHPAPPPPPEREGVRAQLAHARWALRQAASVARGLVWTRLGLAIFNGLIPATFVFGAREIIDDLRVSATLADAMPWIVIVPVLSVAAVILRPVTGLVTSRLADELHLAISLLILEHGSRLDLAFFEDPESQDTLSRVQANSARHIQALVDEVTGFLRNTVQLLGLMVVILLIEPLVVLLLGLLAVPYLAYQVRLSRTYYWLEHNREGRRRWTTYFTGKLIQAAAVPEVKLYDLAPHLIERFREIMTEIRDQNRSIYVRRAVGGLAFGVLGAIVIYVLVFQLASEALTGETSVGSVAAYLLAVERLAATVTQLVHLAALSVHSGLMVSNLRGFLETPVAEKPGVAARLEGPVRGEIEFRDVSFRYPGSAERVLHDVSFRIEPGEVVALVGPNGAGKSTIVKLLGRLYDPEAGTILLDGHDVAQRSEESVRAQLAFVLQGFNRYEATARDNVAYGDWRRLMHRPDEVEAITARVGAAKMISHLPDGYDTHLGRMFGEVTLSGGQWQLLAMARALARDANVLVFDEPTSNLDARTEHEIFTQLRELARGRTVLLISHRFTTVRMANRILVLEAGRLVEEGSHEELVSRDGVYARLYELHRRMFEPRPMRIDAGASGAS